MVQWCNAQCKKAEMCVVFGRGDFEMDYLVINDN